MRTLAIILACVVGPALIPIGIVVVMERRAEPLVHPPALVWGDRVFVSKAQFASWLEERGASYQEWVGRHPGASPWERRAALAVGQAKPAAAAKAASADRRAGEERSVGEWLGDALGRARGALEPALVAAFGGLILAIALLARGRRRIAGFVAWRASRFRLRGTVETFGGLAVLAAKAGTLPGRLWAGARAGGSRLVGAGAQPAMAAGGVHRLSLAVARAPAVRELSGASRGVRRRHGPRRTVNPRVQPVEPEPDPAASAGAVDEMPQAADCERAPEASPVDEDRAPEARVAAAAGLSEPVQARPVVEHVLEPVGAERAAEGAAAASFGAMSERVEPELATAAPAAVPPAVVALERAPERVESEPEQDPAAESPRTPVAPEPVSAEQAPVAAADAPVAREETAVDERSVRPRRRSRLPRASSESDRTELPERVEPELAAAAPAAVPPAVGTVERAPEPVPSAVARHEPEPVEPEVAPEPPRAQARVPAEHVAEPRAAEHAPVAAAAAAPVADEETAVDVEPASEAPVAAAAGKSEPMRATPAVVVEHVLEPVEVERAADGAAAASLEPIAERVEPELIAAAPAAVPPAVVAVERAPEKPEPEPDHAAEAPHSPVAPEPVPAAVARHEPEPVAPEPPRAQARVRAAQVVEPVAAERAPVAAADVAPEPVAPAAAVEQDRASADPITLNDQAPVCTIGVWHGYVKSRFYARVSTPDGETYALAESPTFRRRGDVPEPVPEAVNAHEALLDRLRAEGWRPVGSLGAWYAICLQPLVPAVVSTPR